MSAKTSTVAVPHITAAEILAETPIAWGKKYPRETTLAEIWQKDRSYLTWSANLESGKRCDNPLPPFQRKLVELAARASSTASSKNAEDLSAELAEVHRWREISQEGIGLEALPRPSTRKCQELLARCTVLAGHNDLDGIYSMAAAISDGEALGGAASGKVPFSKLRVLRYGLRDLNEFTTKLDFTEKDTLVIIDFSAHPAAQLNLDHHTTSLSFWEFGSPLPFGIYDPAMPSCPRLLAEHCGLKIPKEVLKGCDMIDGAIYPDLTAASNLDNKFVALAHALDLDVSETVLKKVVITLATNKLDPDSILREEIWQARIKLLKLELDEQRRYWEKGNRFTFPSEYLAVADARLAPYSSTRFRFLPFENSEASTRPYLLTLRASGGNQLVNLGFGRNPFYQPREFYDENPFNAGAFARALGGGGGRMEVASVTVPAQQGASAIERIVKAIGNSVTQGR